MKRTNPETEQRVLNQILLGYSYPDIAKSLGLAVSTVKKIKARNKALYEANKAEFTLWTVDQAKKTRQHAYALINRHLDQERAGIRKIPLKDLVRLIEHLERVAVLDANEPKTQAQKQEELDQLLASLRKK